jgi:glycosyltransferase involved in cell wall biosynthesis
MKSANIILDKEIDSNGPLVSIIVITYNSADYVLETLYSVKRQSYKNVELIISDDCSTDTTIDICTKWLETNSKRFIRSEILPSFRNSGIPANANRGIKSAKGEWIKTIAGDDILSEDAIYRYVDYINKHPDINILSSNVFRFQSDNIENGYSTEMHLHPFYFENTTAADQHQYLLRFNRVAAPSVIIKKSLFGEIGYFDESFYLLEDYPFWLIVTQNNFKIYNIPDVAVYYRIHNNSTSQRNKLTHRIDKTNEILLRLQKEYIVKRLPFIEKIGLFQTIASTELILKLGNKRNGILETIIFYLFKYTNIFSIYRRALKVFNLSDKYTKYW